MAIKKKADCTKCKNFASLYCRDCIHREWLMDFYREAEYETTISQVNEESDEDRQEVQSCDA